MPLTIPPRGWGESEVLEMLDELPRTSTGKVRKNVLREQEWAGRDRKIN